ncbi:hypothetical protein Zmor_021576 [Zophobas morio]|uniref:Uncharacterized protein n=1 Tax=Zophobas morio TaxID=2755281 RepID=A0AA38I2X5_9CUCU|nr:hypothetical protein Zmor_021576 [Zophobas morio]
MICFLYKTKTGHIAAKCPNILDNNIVQEHDTGIIAINEALQSTLNYPSTPDAITAPKIGESNTTTNTTKRKAVTDSTTFKDLVLPPPFPKTPVKSKSAKRARKLHSSENLTLPKTSSNESLPSIAYTLK